MTQEEFDKLPSCIRYKHPNSSCRKIYIQNGTDCCLTCKGYKYFAREYYGDLFTEEFAREYYGDFFTEKKL